MIDAEHPRASFGAAVSSAWAVRVWTGRWWPWLVLAVGVLIIVLGGILFTATS